MKKRNTTIVATRILIMNERHSIRHFFTNRRIQDKYAIKKATPSPIFIKIIVKFRELGRGGHKESGDNVHSYNRAPSLIDADKCQDFTMCSITKRARKSQQRTNCSEMYDNIGGRV
jgi:hypothetical protein